MLQPELKLGGALKAVQVIFEEHACSKRISLSNSLSILPACPVADAKFKVKEGQHPGCPLSFFPSPET